MTDTEDVQRYADAIMAMIKQDQDTGQVPPLAQGDRLPVQRSGQRADGEELGVAPASYHPLARPQVQLPRRRRLERVGLVRAFVASRDHRVGVPTLQPQVATLSILRVRPLGAVETAPR